MSSKTHRPLLAALLIAAAVGAAAAPARAQLTPKAYFSPHGGGADATAERIDEARETIDVAMYSISTGGPIWDALERATARGVRVRIILNDGDGSNASKARGLENIGVHVFTTSRTLHEKFALFDAGIWYRRKLVNGSANWSTGAETRYSENTVVYGRHYHLFFQFQDEFNRLLAEAEPLSADAANHQDPVHLNTPSSSVRRYERAVFSSQNSGSSTYVVADAIIDLIRSAKESIIIDVAHFNSRRIADALIDFHRDNPQVRIEVLLDMGEYADGKSRCRDLERAGIDVRYKTYSLAFVHGRSQLQHHKTIIVDEEHMVTGSYNWSDTAEHSNYENAIVVQGDVSRNRPFLRAFVQEHERLWDQGRDRYPAMLAAMTAEPDDPEYRRYIPIHFDTNYFEGPMALTRDEVRPLRSAAWAYGLWNRQPDGRSNTEFSYLDRETRDVFRGTPSGTFIDAPTSGAGIGLVGALGAADDAD